MSERTQENISLDSLIIVEQVRKQGDDESLDGLSQSMRESGLHAPIQVLRQNNGKFRVVFGHRRVEAARKAGWLFIPAFVEEGNLTSADILIRQLVENVQREDLSPIQAARGINELIKATGANAAQTASKLGLTSGTVSKLLSLLSLPEELQKRIDSGELPATTAYQLTKLDDPEAQKRLASEAASGKLTRDAVSIAVKAKKRRSSRPRKPRPVRVTAKLENRETVSVGADSLDLDSFVSILEKLLAHAVRARADGLTLETLIKRLTASRSAAKPIENSA